MIVVGTSLPELFTAFIATSKNMGELAAGNILGANILNLLWVLGFSSLIKPLPIDETTIMLTMPVMLVITTLMLLFMKKNNSLIRSHGLVLLVVYLSFIFYLLIFGYT